MADENDRMTAAGIRYLLALEEMDRAGAGVKSSHIAQRLGVTRPSVHTMVKRLAQRGYVAQEKYEAVHLTALGRRTGRQYRECFEALCAMVRASLVLPPADGENAVLAMLAETDAAGLNRLHEKLCGPKAQSDPSPKTV